MAIRTRVSSAWTDTEDVQTPVISGARQQAEAVRVMVAGAWQDVWTAIQWMLELENTMTYASGGLGTGTGGTRKWVISCSQNEGGLVTYYIEGNFVNPKVTFDWYGMFSYINSTGETVYAPAGDIDVYYRNTAGTAAYWHAVPNINAANGNNEGSYEITLSGTFDRVGFSINLNSWNVSSPMYWIEIWNFMIDGKECLPSEEYEFNL